MRLRSRPAVAGNNPLHITIFLITNCHRFLPDLYVRSRGYNISKSIAGYIIGVSESFSSFCVNASSERLAASSRSVIWLPNDQRYSLTQQIGGICFELQDTPLVSSPMDGSENTASTSYILLKVSRLTVSMDSLSDLLTKSPPQSIPLSLRAMFSQYFQLGHRIRKHYLSPRVVLCLVTGRFVPPIHRKSLYSLQYSMLPARRASILEVWQRLTEKTLPTTDCNGAIPRGLNGRIRGSYGSTNAKRP